MLVKNFDTDCEGILANINEIFEADGQPGQVLWRPTLDKGDDVPDAVVFIEETSRFSLVIVTPMCRVDGKNWSVIDSGGSTRMENPLERAWRASQGVRRAISERVDFNAYVIPVVVFANMKPSDDIMAALGKSQVKVLWGIDGLVNRLLCLPTKKQLQPTLNAKFIENEVEALMQGPETAASQQGSPSTDESDPGDLDLSGRGVYMHHVDQVVININLDR